ncbi:MAG: hypothetical protein WD077_03465 [Bacteroidia bacterium]
MKSIVVTPRNAREMEFLLKLLEKLGIKNKSLSEEEMEDAGLALLMREGNRNDKVSEHEILAKL